LLSSSSASPRLCPLCFRVLLHAPMTTISSSLLPAAVNDGVRAPIQSATSLSTPPLPVQNSMVVVQTNKLVQERSTRVNQYQLNRVVGKGQHGSVRLATSVTDQKHYVRAPSSTSPQRSNLSPYRLSRSCHVYQSTSICPALSRM
jgi:hypothetical protein